MNFRIYPHRSVLCLLILSCVISAAAQDPYKSATDPSVSSVPQSRVSPAKPENVPDDFVIGAQDMLAINVWKEPEVSRAVEVRPDGKISLPLVGELQAAGQSPRQLEKDIASKLKSYISEPEVTVIVQEIKSKRFNILGMVVRPGSYPLASSATVLDAIALAGGFRDFARQKSIYVLRHNPEGGESRLPFNYKEVIKGKNSNQNVALKAGDTVVIP